MWFEVDDEPQSHCADLHCLGTGMLNHVRADRVCELIEFLLEHRHGFWQGMKPVRKPRPGTPQLGENELTGATVSIMASRVPVCGFGWRKSPHIKPPSAPKPV
ncbi:hypothetical protein [Mycobacterium timonense]|uniref:hypothetical protein n=1 Tax=Mycobacterium timonense TaxID=701043 RepID=UPI00114D8064|nr:hypothetical protein [Mycobacterium timonense]